jgi:hypothetical protein
MTDTGTQPLMEPLAGVLPGMGTGTPPGMPPAPVPPDAPPTPAQSGGPPPPKKGGQANKVHRVSTLLSTNADTEESRVVGEVMNLFREARAYRAPLVQRWLKNYRTLRNRYWASARPDWMPHPEIPEVFPILASMVGWMTDQRIDLEVFPSTMPFSPYNEELYRVAQDLETVMDASWHVNNEEAQLTVMLWDSQIYGTGILKTVWDNTLFGGAGDAVIRRVDPFSFYPDPNARSMDDANYFCEVRRVSVQELDRRFPGAAAKFPSGTVDEVDAPPDQIEGFSSFPKANPGRISGVGSGVYGRPGQGAQVSVTSNPGVTLIECWVREHELYETTVTDEDGTEHKDTRIYDTWRVIVIAGGRVLMNECADELWRHGQHPYSRYLPYDLGEFWGQSLAEMLSSPQESINRLLASMQMNVELTGNPVLVESVRAGLARTQITNKPGTRLTKNEGADLDWLKPPQMHPVMPILMQHYLSRMEAVSGLSAVTKGQNAGGRNAQGVIDSLQESAFVRVRMALRNLEFTLRSAGYLKASLIAEYYTTPRNVAILGNDGGRASLWLRPRHFYMPDEEGGEPLKFSMLVNAGANTHTSRKVREDQAVMLFTLGALDVEGLLEAIEFPNRQEVARRVNEKMAQGAMQAPGARQKAGRTS